MENGWIKVEDALPKLDIISDGWSMSRVVLVYGTDGYPKIAHYNYNSVLDPVFSWQGVGKDNITHWQYIKPPC